MRYINISSVLLVALISFLLSCNGKQEKISVDEEISKTEKEKNSAEEKTNNKGNGKGSKRGNKTSGDGKGKSVKSGSKSV